MDKVTVYIPTEKWNRGQSGGWGDGKTGCANTFIQKADGVMSAFGSAQSRLDPTVTNEIIRINDSRTTPDSYKKLALQTLCEPYGINLVFVDPQPAECEVPVAVRKDGEDLATV